MSDVIAREIILLDALRGVRAAALAAGAEVVPLKGAALLELGLYAPGERPMTDVDLLVRPEDLEVLEKVLASLGYSPMEGSSDAWLRPSPGNAPPAIIDVHTALRHARDQRELFDWGLERGPEGLRLGPEDLFLHLALHPLLHHGEFTPRALEDCRRAASYGSRREGNVFWPSAARKAAVQGVRGAVWPAVSRLAAEGGLSPAEAEAFRPRGASERMQAALFERAARKPSRLLEYMLPAALRPGLAAGYVLPPRRFMLRRYGGASMALYALRPLRLLASVLFGRGR